MGDFRTTNCVGPNWRRTGTIVDGGPDYIIVRYAVGGTQTLRSAGNHSRLVGQRVTVDQYGRGEYTTYRVDIPDLDAKEFAVA